MNFSEFIQTLENMPLREIVHGLLTLPLILAAIKKGIDVIRYFIERQTATTALGLSSLFRQRYSNRIKELEIRDDSIRMVHFHHQKLELKKVVRAYAQVAELDIQVVEHMLGEPLRKEGAVHLSPMEFIAAVEGLSARREKLISTRWEVWKFAIERKIVDAAILGANAGLLRSAILGKLSIGSRSAIDDNTIVGMLLSEKIKAYTKAYAYLLSAFVLIVAAKTIGWIDDPLPGYIVVVFFLLVMFLNQWALAYRIGHNLYGTAPTEVREIISYIDAHSDKSDFIDRGKPKRFAPDYEEKEQRIRYFSGETA
jgi:hypothetical protein